MTEKEWLQIVVVPLITALLAAIVQIFIANMRRTSHPPRQNNEIGEIATPRGIIKVHPSPAPQKIFPWKRIWLVSLLIASSCVLVLLLPTTPMIQYVYPLKPTLSLIAPSSIAQGSAPTSLSQLTTSIPSPTTFRVLPTPVPKGSLLASYNFDKRPDGYCDDYDTARVGYADSKYYVVPGSNGYIAVCAQQARWQPKGSLEVIASSNDPEPKTYGYGLLWGWEGTLGNTQNACAFSVRKNRYSALSGGFLIQSDPIYEYEFLQIKDGAYIRESDVMRIRTLDTSKHILRFSLDPDGVAIGYFDDNFVAAYKFSGCKLGFIGMIAYGDNQTKMLFDDLRVYSR